MATFVHLSDLHFGKEDQVAVAATKRLIEKTAPTFIIVSGDLTQRARSREFIQAAKFFDQFAAETLIVPGNHDIPLWNVKKRIFRPFSKWQANLQEELSFKRLHDNVLYLGLNSVVPFHIASGRLSSKQRELVLEEIKGTSAPNVVITTHHPIFDLSHKGRSTQLVPSDWAFELCKEKTAICLSGHHHVGDSSNVSLGGRSIVACAAGTALSQRRRGEANSLNVISLAKDDIEVNKFNLESDRFMKSKGQRYKRQSGGWILQDS